MLERALAQSPPGRAAQVQEDLAAFKREAARSAADLDGRRTKLVTWYRTVTGR